MLLSNADYHASPGLSKSATDNIEESPKFYQWKLKNPDEMTTALIFGGAWHCHVLPLHASDERFEDLYFINKTQPQDPVRDERGRAPLGQKNYDKILAMAAEFKRNRLAQNMLAEALVEVSFFWTDPETGILCKCKPDAWIVDKRLIWDAKTTEDCSLKKFRYSARDYRYHVQGSWLTNGVALACQQAGIQLNGYEPTRFALVAQEKCEPWDIGFFPLGPRTMTKGDMDVRRNLNTYAQCVRTGQWPGKTGDKFVELEFGPWDLEEAGEDYAG